MGEDPNAHTLYIQLVAVRGLKQGMYRTSPSMQGTTEIRTKQKTSNAVPGAIIRIFFHSVIRPEVVPGSCLPQFFFSALKLHFSRIHPISTSVSIPSGLRNAGSNQWFSTHNGLMYGEGIASGRRHTPVASGGTRAKSRCRVHKVCALFDA